jgi:hypothetical protein
MCRTVFRRICWRILKLGCRIANINRQLSYRKIYHLGEKLVTITNAIKQTLLKFPETRDSSALLFVKVCDLWGIDLPYEADKAPKPETVGRLAHRVKRIYGWK